jgi:hypothetical protein
LRLIVEIEIAERLPSGVANGEGLGVFLGPTTAAGSGGAKTSGDDSDRTQQERCDWVGLEIDFATVLDRY